MGFQLDLSQSSAGHDGKLETYSVDAGHATLLAPCDVVTITGTGSVDGIAGVDTGAQGSAITGVVSSFEVQYAGENLTGTGLPAATAGKARVHVDPNLNFIVDVTGGTLSAADIGLNADAAFTTATKSGGLTISKMTLDAATKAATSTLQFRIVGLAPSAVDDQPDGTKARVRLNNTTTRSGAAGV